MATVKQLDDLDIPRDRGVRTLVFFGTPVLFSTIGGFVVGSLFDFFLNQKGFFWIGIVVGVVAGMIGFLSMKHLFVVRNNSTGMLVTIDQLKSLFTTQQSHVIYGNGTHFSFPWERRLAENNIPVTEVAEDFSFTAICQDGTVSGTGSFRLRPDFEKPINYLSGVAAVGKDFKDLVIAFITDWFASRPLQQAVSDKAMLNQALRDEFAGTSITEFESRFGVQVGDVTVGELRFSAEVEKTRNAINEAQVIALGTATILGFTTVAEMQQALNDEKISQADVDVARRLFLIVSDNIDDASTTRFEIDIKGLSPEAGTAISALISNPNVANALKNFGNKKQPQKGGRK